MRSNERWRPLVTSCFPSSPLGSPSYLPTPGYSITLYPEPSLFNPSLGIPGKQDNREHARHHNHLIFSKTKRVSINQQNPSTWQSPAALTAHHSTSLPTPWWPQCSITAVIFPSPAFPKISSSIFWITLTKTWPLRSSFGKSQDSSGVLSCDVTLGTFRGAGMMAVLCKDSSG